MACLACASWLGEPPKAELQRIPTACVTRYRQPPLEDRMLGLAIVRREITPGDVVLAGGRRAKVVGLPFGAEDLDG